jgi:hypothetical protein
LKPFFLEGFHTLLFLDMCNTIKGVDTMNSLHFLHVCLLTFVVVSITFESNNNKKKDSHEERDRLM